MWVELKSVSKTGIVFSLESEGRYFSDKYYVGSLTDPQTGQATTDRRLELRLHAVGTNPLAYRQAGLLMQTLPMLREKVTMTPAEQLVYCKEVIKLSPWSEGPWQSIAKLSREGVLGKEYGKQMLATLESLFTTFAALPDFTWTVFDDLIVFQTVPRQRAKLYGRLLTLYEQAKRPDLSCEARLKYVDYLVKDGRYKEAVEGLAVTVKLFPDEGRYVPRLLDRLEAVCKEGKIVRSEEGLARFYKEYLPLVPRMRGDRASLFCMDVYKRGIAHFQSSGNTELAQLYSGRLQQLKSEKQLK
jgi:hypothetical protein